MREPPSKDVVYGRWPVREALTQATVSKVFMAKGVQGRPIEEIKNLALKKKVPFQWVDRRRLDQLAEGNHQGVVATVSPLEFTPLNDLLHEVSSQQRKNALFLMLDEIQDPQNLGSIMRTASFFGIQGVVFPKWRSASITSSAIRASAGGAHYLDLCQVSNLRQAMEVVREAGIWLIGADMDGKEVKEEDVPRPFVLVLGGEGKGLGALVKKKCDLIVKIQGSVQKPGVDSLNVGVACGVLLHQFS